MLYPKAMIDSKTDEIRIFLRLDKPKCANPDGFTGKDYKAHSHMRCTYGVGLDWYNEKFAEQEGCCAICGVHQSKLKKRLNVDHNHKTGQLRDLLCFNCNSLLGKCHEDIDILSKIADYITKWSVL